MNPRFRILSPFAFYLAVAAALVSLGLIIIRQQFDLYLQISLGFVFIGIALSIIFNPEKARIILTGRQVKYTSNAIVLYLAVAGILVVINYLSASYPLRWDLSEDQSNSLSNESVKVLANLSEPVTAQAFFTPAYPSDYAEKLLSNYKYNSQGKFDYQFIDPDSDPISARTANVTRDGTIVLKLAGRQEIVTYADEQEITSALIRLANPGSRVIYFLTGHGEIGLDDSSETGLSLLISDLQGKNYSVKDLNLISTPSIPDDALAIIIVRPQATTTTTEAELIKTYMEGGRSLVLLLEPDSLSGGFQIQDDPLFSYLKDQWGISSNQDFLVDPNVNPPLAVASDYYESHPITQKMQSLVTIFPTTRSLKVDTSPENITATELVKTSYYSWGETDFASIESNQVSFDESTDLPGPLTVAAVAENHQNKSRVVVFGDSDFALDDNYRNFGNGTMIINAIDWASHQDTLIQLSAREKTNRLILPPQKYSLGLVLFGSVFLIPSLILFTGIVVFIQRRKRS